MQILYYIIAISKAAARNLTYLCYVLLHYFIRSACIKLIDRQIYLDTLFYFLNSKRLNLHALLKLSVVCFLRCFLLYSRQ